MSRRAAKPQPPLKIEFITPANGKLGKSMFSVLDEAGETLYTDKVDPADAKDRERAAKKMASELGRPLKKMTDSLNKACNKTAQEYRRFREQAAAGSPEAAPRGPCYLPGDDRPTIIIGPEEHEVNAQAAEALARDPGIFQRGSMLVRVVRDGSPATKGVRRSFAPRIDPLPLAMLRERLAANAHWVTVRTTENGEQIRPDHPPGWSVAAVGARADWPGIRHLEAVVDYPVLRHDGTILTTPGYDVSTGLLLESRGKIPPIPESPTKADALAAVEALFEVVRDFPFEAAIHWAAWLAALLTPLARFTFTGPSPLFLVDANTRGAGKGLLLHCIARIVTGEDFTIASYTNDDDEMRKRITSLAMGGERLVLFDNLESKFGGPSLDAALTATVWKDRVLGVNRMMEAPLYMSWYATGNNVMVAGDTSRRICHVRLESPEEKPEERTDLVHPNLLTWVGSNRANLLRAALIILRAYHVAGRPDMGLQAWGTYENWSAAVRSPIVWAGLPDPGKTRMLLQRQADVAAEAMEILLNCWEKMDPDRRGMTAAEIVQTLYKRADKKQAELYQEPTYYTDMRDALESLVGKPDARNVGTKLRFFRRRLFGSRFVDQAGTKHQAARWAVFPAASFGRKRPCESGESGESGESFPAVGDSNSGIFHGGENSKSKSQPGETDSPDSPDSPVQEEADWEDYRDSQEEVPF
jgi:hypothetical protein